MSSRATTGSAGVVIDGDVHNALPDLDRFIPAVWAGGWRTASVPTSHNYANPRGGVARKDVTPPNGGAPASDPYFLISDHLDPYGIDYAILTGPHLIHLGTDLDYQNMMARAMNECTAATWLTISDRFRGSILVNLDDPHAAAREIRHWASDKRFVQVIAAAATRRPIGQREFWPIFEACSETGLPLAVHPGTEGAGTAFPPTPMGWPSRYMEWHNILPIGYMAQINSLVTEGAFEHFPSLRFIAIEGGTAWLPHLMWRMNKNYKALRDTTPWLTRLPSEYILDHVRLTTQPIEEPRRPEELTQILAMIEAERTLMFSSDYPHWDYDNANLILTAIDSSTRARIMGETAAELYGIIRMPLPEDLPAHLPATDEPVEQPMTEAVPVE
ncbi:amidohydrolase family protein [Ruania alba]|uniref:Predicted metal-dependent hydrolase, TIM-barrel fold n=1 Tax=Ruania alba TaxID=648782 RepID=A0A1H5BW43_9MICO|nr:amidohydrolase family protein [Ruania alba]SED58421.1 Predicted metal-dependent hydrolase, TIM-barrel fold [Ruania alba]